jgi:hypothetical protein
MKTSRHQQLRRKLWRHGRKNDLVYRTYVVTQLDDLVRGIYEPSAHKRVARSINLHKISGISCSALSLTQFTAAGLLASLVA